MRILEEALMPLARGDGAAWAPEKPTGRNYVFLPRVERCHRDPRSPAAFEGLTELPLQDALVTMWPNCLTIRRRATPRGDTNAPTPRRWARRPDPVPT